MANVTETTVANEPDSGLRLHYGLLWIPVSCCQSSSWGPNKMKAVYTVLKTLQYKTKRYQRYHCLICLGLVHAQAALT